MLGQYLERADYNQDVDEPTELLKYNSVDLEDVTSCLRSCANTSHVLVIDGINENPENEQPALLRAFTCISRGGANKLFLTSRNSMSDSMKRIFEKLLIVSTDFPEACPSISTYHRYLC